MTDAEARADFIRHVVPLLIRRNRIRPLRARRLAALLRRNR